MLLLTVGVQATTEEAVFRGYMLQVAGSQLPAWPAVIIVSVFFAAVHPTTNPFAMANIVLVALFLRVPLACARVDLGGRGIPHRLELGAGQPPRHPIAASPATFRSWHRRRSAWWCSLGPEFGIEGSAAATVVLAGLMVASFVYYRRVEAGRKTRRSRAEQQHLAPSTRRSVIGSRAADPWTDRSRVHCPHASQTGNGTVAAATVPLGGGMGRGAFR